MHLVGVHLRLVQAMPKAGDIRLAGEPIPEKLARDLQLERGGANAPKLAWQIGFVRNQLLERLAAPLESVRVVVRTGLVVHQAIRRDAPPLPLPRVFVSLELDEEERDAVLRLHPPLALGGELVCLRVLGRGVVEDDHIPALLAQKAVLQKGEQHHPAGAPARKLDDVRKLRVALRLVSETVILFRVVALGFLQLLGYRKFRHRPHTRHSPNASCAML